MRNKNEIFDPIKIGQVEIKNRLGLAPINTGLLNDTGLCSRLFIDFYQQYIIEELGIIYIGGIAIDSSAKANASSFILNNIKKCGDLIKVIQSAHLKGVKVIVQLEHAGRQANPIEIKAPIYAPSPIPCPVVGVIPIELDENGIKNIKLSFLKAAMIAEDCGTDIIEIHAAHGYLISSFLSPISNHRFDKYGGDINNRTRFLYEILDLLNNNLSIPVGIRLNCTDNVQGGISIEEISWVLDNIKSLIKYVSLAGGMYTPYEDVIIPSSKLGFAIWRNYAKILKSKIDLPIFLSGNIFSIQMAEQLINDKTTDIVLMCRALLADPNLLSKYINGDTKITSCTECNKCKYHSKKKQYIDCPFNPVLSLKNS